VLFAGVFPASVFALPVLFGSGEEPGPKKDFYLWMLILFWTVLILFTLVRTKIVHYSSLCYFPLTFLATWSFIHARSVSGLWGILTKGLIITLGSILALTVIVLTYIDRYKDMLIDRGWIVDPFAKGCLMADAEWKGYEFIAGLILLIGLSGFTMFWRKKRFDHALIMLTGTLPVFMIVSMILIVPRVEAYSQRAAVDFFQSLSDRDVYLETVGYKSYVHLFYGRVKNTAPRDGRDEKWLLTGPIDKDAYFSIKVTRMERFMKEYPDAELLYEKNGFVFLKRTSKTLPD